MNIRTSTGTLIQSAPQNATSSDYELLVGTADQVIDGVGPAVMDMDSDSTPRNIDLGSEADNRGRTVCVRNINGAANTIQVRDSGASNVGAVIAAGNSGFYYCNGTTWTKVGVGSNA